LARAGWAAFQTIETEGGLAAALVGGHIARVTHAVRDAREAAIREGSVKIVGVTAFPNAAEGPVAIETPDIAAFATQGPSPRLPGPDTACRPLNPIRLAAPFEEGR
jgi:methylmalonyl-CoA mutase